MSYWFRLLALSLLLSAGCGLRAAAQSRGLDSLRAQYWALRTDSAAYTRRALGRVLLNLRTNALYAVRQRQLTGEAGYEPVVAVSSRVLPGGTVEIRARDNGTGISAAVQVRISEPFFTTKPAG